MEKVVLGVVIAFIGTLNFAFYQNENIIIKETKINVSEKDRIHKQKKEEIADKYNLDLEQKGRKRKFDFDAGHSFHSKEK